LKTPLLLLLWTLILTPLAFGISPSENSTPTSASESPTVSNPQAPQQTPDWARILPLDPVTAKIVGDQIDIVLKDAWERGYKAAEVKYEPMTEYWMTKATTPTSRTDRFWEGFGWGSAAGAAGGVVFTVVLVKAALVLWGR
jgi:hypothetical protein